MTDAVTVIVVTHDSAGHVRRCLACLADQTRPPERIIVIDSGSRDGSAAAAVAAIAADSRLRDRAEVHELGANLGFAAANNRGIATAATPLVALLNPDAFPEPDWLERLVAAAGRHGDAAAFGSRQMIDGRPGIVDGLGDRCHVGGLVWRSGHGRRLAAADLRDAEIFSPCAAAALYRTAAIRDVGGLDESFFCYVEDVDLGFRLRLAGHTARIVPDAVVHHVGGDKACRRRRRTALILGHRNLVWSYVKNMPPVLLVAFLPVHLLQTILVGVVLACRGDGGAFFRAKCAAVHGLPRAWRQRQAVQAARRASAVTILRSLDTSVFIRR